MDERALRDGALAGGEAAVRALVAHVAGGIEAEAARALYRRRGVDRRDARQEIDDLVQEVFVALFEEDAKRLRAWDPARGLPLVRFCRVVASREIASILRSGRRSPWTDVPDDTLDGRATSGEELEARVASREALVQLLDRLRTELSPRALELFERLIVDEEPVASVGAAYGLTSDAVYAWRSRLGRRARAILSDLTQTASERALAAESP